MLPTPVIVNSLTDLLLEESIALAGGPAESISLENLYDDPLTTGVIARFELFDTSIGNDGVFEAVLFDQPGAGAPISVARFRELAPENPDNPYANSIIHRAAETIFEDTNGNGILDGGDEFEEFVIQGGGFTVDDFQGLPLDQISVAEINDSLDLPFIQNEFDPNRSNLRGTLAYARLGGIVDSATTEWFFTLDDRAASNLDNQNGGFTVFGQARTAADLAAIDAIAAMPDFDASPVFGGAFNDLPLTVDDPQNPEIASDENFVRFRSITTQDVAEFEFTVESSDPGLVTVGVDANTNSLLLNTVPGSSGIATITVTATSLLGEEIVEEFDYAVSDTFIAQAQPLPTVFAIAPSQDATFEGFVDLDSVFTGIDLLADLPDGDDFEITVGSAVSADDTLVQANVVDDDLQLELQANAFGDTTVTVTASALAGTDTLDASFNVSLRADPNLSLTPIAQQAATDLSARLATPTSATANLLASAAFADIANSASGAGLLAALDATLADDAADPALVADLSLALGLQGVGESVFAL